MISRNTNKHDKTMKEEARSQICLQLSPVMV